MEPAPVAIKLIEPEENDEWQPRKTAQAFQEQMRALQKATMARARGEQAGEQERQADFDDTRPPEEEAEQRSKVVSLKDWRVRYYHNDHLGTPRELSDEDGGIVWQATYKAWGNTLKVEAARPATLQNQELLAQTARRAEAKNDLNAELQPIEQNLRFQGQYFDEETGLHYNRFRYYDPDVGRFVSQDPIRLDGGLNLYEYAPNPTSWVDVYGLKKCKPCPVDCDKILNDEGVVTGRHGDLRKIGGLQDSHHIYQDAAVNGLKGYDYNDAIAISIQGRNPNGTTRGTPHYNANQVQNTAKNGGLLGSETVVAFKSLRAAGLSPQAAKCATLKARGYLEGIGSGAGTSTQIPSKRKIP